MAEVKLTRLPPAAPPDGDALRALHTAGAHFVLCLPDKRPIAKGWEQHPANLDAVIEHRGRGGLVGIMPGSIGAVVVDLDPDGDTPPVAAPPPATVNGTTVNGRAGRSVHLNAAAVASLASAPAPPLGGFVLQNATRRAGGVHWWYRAPDGEVRNRKWKHGDIRGSRGFVVLWDAGAVAAAVIGDEFTMADPVDLAKLPAAPRKRAGSDVEQMRAAANGERNDLFNRLAFARAKRGENMATLRTAAIATGLTVTEVAATIRSAEEGAERAKADTARAIAGATTSEADLGAEYMRIHQGNRLHRSDDLWFWWADNAGWTLDQGANESLAEVMRLGRDTFCRIGKEGPRPDPTTGGRVSTARGALTYARSLCWSDAEQWDSDPWLIGVPGGRVADLRTGAIRARTRADLIERSVSAAPSKEWRDTRWAAFLEEMIDADALEWLRVLCGYALTGLTREHVLVFIYGRERTGKGTLLSAIADAVGDYSRRIDADDLMEQTGREHPAWLADLRGRRVVVADEMPRGKRWNTARVKKLVSGEPIRARLMHRDFFEFKPTAQVIVAGNHAPQQSSADTGLERRLRVVRAERQPDVEDVRLLDKLKPEHVLSWLLEGAAQYHVEGLRPTPASVAAGTRAYAEQSDILREFLATIADWPQVRAEMYRKYRAWTEIDGGKPLGKQRFNSTLREDYHFEEFTPRGGTSSWRRPA